MPGQPLNGQLLVEVPQRPFPGRGGRVVVGFRHLSVDELGLTAFAPRRHDAIPRHRIGHLGAVIGAAAYNQELATFLIGIGVGAIVQVIVLLVPSIRDREGEVL